MSKVNLNNWYQAAKKIYQRIDRNWAIRISQIESGRLDWRPRPAAGGINSARLPQNIDKSWTKINRQLLNYDRQRLADNRLKVSPQPLWLRFQAGRLNWQRRLLFRIKTNLVKIYWRLAKNRI